MAVVTNWNDCEKLFHHTFYNELRVTPEEHPTCILSPPHNAKNNLEKITSIMFETFNVPGLMIASEPVCSLVASGRTTGNVLESGYTCSYSTCIVDASPMNYTSMKMNIGGNDITQYLVKILSERGYEMTTSAEREIVRDIKEKLCYVAFDYEKELEKAEQSGHCEHEYELPDGSKMTIGSERFRAPEILFQPEFIGSESPNLPEIISMSIGLCNKDLQNDMFQNIVLAGGSTMFEGIVERLHTDLCYYNDRSFLKVNAPAERKFSAWIGASIMTSMSHFDPLWITKDMYDDAGATIVHRMHI